MHASIKPLSGLTGSTRRPTTAAAAFPRFTCHALPSALYSPSCTGTRMPLLLKNLPVPSNTSFGIICSSSTVSCKYTSVPERMGEEEEPSAAAPHNDPKEQARLDGKRRQRDAADQQHATRVLHNIESAAVQDSPEDAGHPEKHRALSTEDYPAPGPPGKPAAHSPTGSFMEPQIADGLPWLGINSSGININNSSIPDDDASLGDSPLSMLAAAASAAAAADAAASAAAAAAAAASNVGPEAGLRGRAVEGMQQAANEQQSAAAGSARQRDVGGVVESGRDEGAEPDNNSLLEPWCENP